MDGCSVYRVTIHCIFGYPYFVAVVRDGSVVADGRKYALRGSVVVIVWRVA